jgi:SAM-dependent methyltransferase
MPLEARTPEQVREHYVLELSLAERLRNAPRAERAAAYASVYDELFRRIPHHPQLLAQRSAGFAAQRRRSVEYQWAFVKRFLRRGGVFMELGAGDCALCARAAAWAERVYAVDVSEEITRGAPPNVEVRLTTGSAVPVPGGTVQVAFSNQLMEHLHPDDALEQVREIRRSLAPGGVYLCITPNRLSGPHDVSRDFDDEAKGLHLREYSARELRAHFREAGFRRLRFFAGARGWYLPVPYALIALAEAFFAALPARVRKALAGLPPARALLGVRVAAVK